jgi:hypothetical protein
MVIGTTLLKSATSYYSPTFERGGLAALFSCELLQVGTAGTLDILVQHKNTEDSGFTLLATFSQLTAAGIGTIEGTAIKEELRFKYTVGGTQDYSFVHFNMLAPAWRPY